MDIFHTGVGGVGLQKMSKLCDIFTAMDSLSWMSGGRNNMDCGKVERCKVLGE